LFSAFLLVVFFFRLFSLTALSAASGKRLKANEPYALIIGTVWGPDDHPAYGVAVKIRRSQDKKAKWELASDHHGEFAQRVPAGKADYIVWADVKGVKTTDGKPLHLLQEVPVHIDNDERIDIGLHLALTAQ
jgi:hypothetical protein